MMDIRQLDEKVAVGAQIAPADLEEIARSGFRPLICNRPDGEDATQPHFDAIAAAARAAGMETVFQPVTSATMSVEDARRFAEAVEKSDGPAFAYCRTGTRCTMLWTIAGVLDGKPKDELREAAANAGYDMANLLDSLPG
ncbi:MAG: TIGR01244 family phosphatase [Ahrensia sp.]|nr:TIGR01244 family phosphatase [Ahrensia sp.]